MTISIIVITKNNQFQIESCLQSAKKLANEIIIVDDFSEDNTLKLAKKYTQKIFQHKLTSFPAQRNWGFKQATGDWLMFLDADERLTKKNITEIKDLIKTTSHVAFRFKRQNYYSARKIRHTGFWPDYQTRLFKRSSFKGVKGATHEDYQYDGTLGTLKQPVPHFPDRSIKLGLKKSLIWTPAEAKAFFKANHPKITWYRLLKVIIWEFFYRYFKKQGFRDGYIGLVESITQAINKFFIYQQIWELQNQDKINAKVKKLEKKLL